MPSPSKHSLTHSLTYSFTLSLRQRQISLKVSLGHNHTHIDAHASLLGNSYQLVSDTPRPTLHLQRLPLPSLPTAHRLHLRPPLQHTHHLHYHIPLYPCHHHHHYITHCPFTILPATVHPQPLSDEVFPFIQFSINSAPGSLPLQLPFIFE